MHRDKLRIPDEFRSFLSEELFENCIICNTYILDDTQYIIEKAVKSGCVEFEYAMCLECAMKMRSAMSEESIRNVENYFRQCVTRQSGKIEKIQSGELLPESLMSRCLFKDFPIEELDEYQLYAHCTGKYLMQPFMPYMISGQALEEISELLSKKTRDEMDGFIDEFFDLPPEWKLALKRKDVILL